MTETEWLASDNPAAMLRHLTHEVHVAEDAVGDHPRSVQLVSDRQLRLFARACVEQGQTHLREIPEDYTPGGMTSLAWATNCATGLPGGPSKEATAAILRDIGSNPFRPVTLPSVCLNCGSDSQEADVDYPCCGRCGRVVFGCLWLTPTVRAIAQIAYNERPPSGFLDPLRLAVLADALMDAGCDDGDLLQHLRNSPHVRGCWVLDLILGK